LNSGLHKIPGNSALGNARDPPPEAEDEAERAATEQDIARWQAEGRFVYVFWGIQHWMSADGKVLSHD
jgi:hypothetical protein